MKRLTIFLVVAATLCVVGPEITLAQCNPDASYVADVTIPDDTVLQPGESFTKVWRLKNSGDCEWGAGYSLVFLGGDKMGASDTQPLEGVVPPGAEVDIRVNMQAPPEPGIYTGHWQMQDPAGTAFGTRVYLRIIVPGPGGELPKPTAPGEEQEMVGKLIFTVLVEHQPAALYDLFVSNLDGSERQKLAEGMRQPDVRSDGLIVADGQGIPGQEFITVMKIDGSEKRDASPFTSDARPRWSPEGNRLLISLSDTNDVTVQEGYNKDSPRHPLPYTMFDISGKHHTWLSEGRIVYNGCIGSDCGLVMIDEFGSPAAMVAKVPDALAPDGYGNKVAFMSQRDGNWEIYTINLDGSNLTRLTENPAADGLPCWSPTGDRIAFLSSRGESWSIWVMNADGTEQVKLFDLGGPMRDDWPDETIAWWSSAEPGVAPEKTAPPPTPILPAATPTPTPPAILPLGTPTPTTPAMPPLGTPTPTTPAMPPLGIPTPTTPAMPPLGTPTPMPPKPTLTPTPTPTSLVPAATDTPIPISPDQPPPGKGLLIINSGIDHEMVLIIANTEHAVPPNSKITIPLDPGHYTWTASIPDIPGTSASGEVDITEGEVIEWIFKF